jgi:SAM-dependent methyltransferase
MSNLTSIIQEKYGQTARSGLSTNNAGVQAVAEAFGYSTEELSAIPAEANMGLSCGNPIALAHLNEGEVVVDLGSGGGLDVFLAAQKVGPSGKAIGIDMTPDMIALAQRNAQKGPEGKPYTNVEFKLGTIDKMPLEDNSVDVIISNCVINLAEDKPAVFREIFRVLKPGGRVAVSDIALKQDLPDELEHSMAAMIGCFAGAIHIHAYQSGLRDAGFGDVAVLDAGSDLNAYSKVEGQSGCCSPVDPSTTSGCCGSDAKNQSLHTDLAEILSRFDVNEYAASVKVLAVKPA